RDHTTIKAGIEAHAHRLARAAIATSEIGAPPSGSPIGILARTANKSGERLQNLRIHVSVYTRPPRRRRARPHDAPRPSFFVPRSPSNNRLTLSQIPGILLVTTAWLALSRDATIVRERSPPSSEVLPRSRKGR